MGYVDYLCRTKLFADAQGQVPVLTSLVPRPVASSTIDQVLAEHAQVADKVLSKQQKGVEVRLEVGVAPDARLIELVLVAVQQARVGMIRNRQRDHGERMFGKHVVVVQQGDPGGRDELER